ncbi:hypothetical protein FQ186_20745 [Pseudomonas sp. ANT_H14]|uniref:hypothetical protein n=1 Tax=unclassified Pseudomonas TaxID=196821 RepID=UPI0011EC57D2|nr:MULTISPECIES: hypothetical protein [unclassified Pseudomonas]KAA0943751.1 hypothetical protein FQ182_23740 [Pseudomonas sp. ANT_H4]KAA0950106.1 hypothetical protein FQ186_20745 [Pseudomonas sp. ANT_H14]
MTTPAPLIGFDRYIRLEWAAAALKARAGLASVDELDAFLATANLGKEALGKTRTKLNGLWLAPRAELLDFADRGAAILKTAPGVSAVALTWGMALASYPFFAKLAEQVGRLTALQDDCSAAEVHRRMNEVYGEREITRRAGQAVLQTQEDWGVIERIEKGRRLLRRPAILVDDPHLVTWLIEAVLRCLGKPLALSSVQTTPVLFPFNLEGSLAFLASGSSHIELRTEGPHSQFIALREGA